MSDASFPDDRMNHEPERSGDADRVTDCEAVIALIPAYSIGATDPEETALVRARLAQCPDAARALAQFMAFDDAFLHAVRPAQPPADLATRLQRALAPKRPVPSPVAQQAQRTPWFRAWRWSTFWVAAAATTILLLVALNAYWIDQNLTLQRRYDALVSLQSQRQATENAAYVLLASGSRQSLEVPPAQEGSYAHAEVLWDPGLNTALLYANKFPPLAADQVYQLWLVKDGERSNGGLFTVDENGVGVLLFPTSVPIDQLDALGVTTEPAGGSDGPTSPAVVRRRFNES